MKSTTIFDELPKKKKRANLNIMEEPILEAPGANVAAAKQLDLFINDLKKTNHVTERSRSNGLKSWDIVQGDLNRLTLSYNPANSNEVHFITYYKNRMIQSGQVPINYDKLKALYVEWSRTRKK